MGIKGLNKFLKKQCKNGITEINYKDLNGKFVGIDTSIFLYKYSYMGDMLSYFLKQIEHLLKYNITPLYLFDGKPTEDKKETINKRKETYKKNKEFIEELHKKKEELSENIEIDEIKEQVLLIEEEIKKKTKNNVKVNFEDVLKFKEILKNLGIFYYECEGETDSFIKSFFDSNLIDYVITEDLDFLTHGCKNVITKYNYSKSKGELYNLDKILQDLTINHQSFVDFCIILGCDYYEKGIKNVGPVKGFQFIKKYKTLSNMLENEESLSKEEDFNYENVLSMFYCNKELNISKDDIKIKKNNLNEDYFKNLSYKTEKLINLVKLFKYRITILSFMEKK